MTEPTDAEIDEFLDSPGNINWVIANARGRWRLFARAVLARWGAQPSPPSPAEFALQALIAAGHVSQELVDKAMVLPGAPQSAHSGEPVAFAFQYDDGTWHDPSTTEHSSGMRPLFAAPHPVERKPLTDEQIRSMCAQPWVFDTVKQWVRITEAAHGIKGGQHGNE